MDCGIDISGLYVPERLKELRMQHKLSQEEVAKVLNVSRREYWRFEQKNYCTRYMNLLMLAMFYNVSMDYIFGITDEQKEIYNPKIYSGEVAVMGIRLSVPNVEQYKKDLAFSKAVAKI